MTFILLYISQRTSKLSATIDGKAERELNENESNVSFDVAYSDRYIKNMYIFWPKESA